MSEEIVEQPREDNERSMLVQALRDMGWTPVRMHLLKRVLPPDIPLAEVVAFVHRCEQWGLDPLNTEQISIQPRMNSKTGEVKYTYIPGIAGRRMLAARTGNYAPGDITRYEYDEQGHLVRAIASVRIYHRESNTWFLVEEEARWAEYVQTYWDKESRTRKPTGLWGTHPTVMLGKTAETRVLRKAFPEVFEGIAVETEYDFLDSEPTPRPRLATQQAPQLVDAAHKALQRTSTRRGPAPGSVIWEAPDVAAETAAKAAEPDPLNSKEIQGE